MQGINSVKDDCFLSNKQFQFNFKMNTLWGNVINNLSLNLRTIKLSCFQIPNWSVSNFPMSLLYNE